MKQDQFQLSLMAAKDEYGRLIKKNAGQGLKEIARHPRAVYGQNRFFSDAALAALDKTERVALEWGLGVGFAYGFPFGLPGHLDEQVQKKIIKMRQQFAGRTSVHAIMAVGKWNAGVARSIFFGLTCGADTFTIHATDIKSVAPWRKDRAHFAATALVELIIKLREWDCKINIENVASPMVWGQDPHDFMSLFYDYSDIKLCLDTGHALNAGFDSDQLAIDFAGRIGEVHFVDTPTVGGPDEHCAYGDGIVDLDALLKALEDTGYAGPIVIEVEPDDLVKSLNWLRERSYI